MSRSRSHCLHPRRIIVNAFYSNLRILAYFFFFLSRGDGPLRLNSNHLDPLILILCPVPFCPGVDRSALFLAIHAGFARCSRHESVIKPHECFKTVPTGRGQTARRTALQCVCVPEQRRGALVSRCRQDDERRGFFRSTLDVCSRSDCCCCSCRSRD